MGENNGNTSEETVYRKWLPSILSISFSLLWVVLISLCIYFVVSSKTGETKLFGFGNPLFVFLYVELAVAVVAVFVAFSVYKLKGAAISLIVLGGLSLNIPMIVCAVLALNNLKLPLEQPANGAKKSGEIATNNDMRAWRPMDYYHVLHDKTAEGDSYRKLTPTVCAVIFSVLWAAMIVGCVSLIHLVCGQEVGNLVGNIIRPNVLISLFACTPIAFSTYKLKGAVISLMVFSVLALNVPVFACAVFALNNLNLPLKPTLKDGQKV